LRLEARARVQGSGKHRFAVALGVRSASLEVRGKSKGSRFKVQNKNKGKMRHNKFQKRYRCYNPSGETNSF
jgi:hypothetical protein